MKKLFKRRNYQLPRGSRWHKMRFWDPLLGCSPCSSGCRICSSARTMWNGRHHRELIQHEHGLSRFNGTVFLNEVAFDEVKDFPPNEQVFVCGRSDTFHEQVPKEYSLRIVEAAEQRPDCTFFAITKRPHRIPHIAFPKNFWISITVENQAMAQKRLPFFGDFQGIKVVSAKPLLGQIDFMPWMDLFDMIIVGGEYGKDARPMHPLWVRYVRDQCLKRKMPFSFHNWGLWLPGAGRVTRYVELDGTLRHEPPGEPAHVHEEGENGTLLDGKIWDEYPCD